MEHNSEPLAIIVTRIETKLDTALMMQKDHETRIRKVEGFRAYLLGASAAVSFAVAHLKTAFFGDSR